MENEFDCFSDWKLILDSCRGIYIPRDFATIADPKFIKDFEKFREDIEICKNPEHEHYWEAWQNILNNMQINLMGNGVFYSLYQDGDLFAVIYKDDPLYADPAE